MYNIFDILPNRSPATQMVKNKVNNSVELAVRKAEFY